MLPRATEGSAGEALTLGSVGRGPGSRRGAERSRAAGEGGRRAGGRSRGGAGGRPAGLAFRGAAGAPAATCGCVPTERRDPGQPRKYRAENRGTKKTPEPELEPSVPPGPGAPSVTSGRLW